MKFIASDTFNANALATGKDIRWTVYVRKTSNLSDSNSGTTGWTNVTDYFTSIPAINSSIEYDLGQFTADNLNLTAIDVNYWNDNLLNLTAGEYLELKVEAQIGINDTYASDTAIMFCGMVDDKSVLYDEVTDSVTFDVYTNDFIGTKIAASAISTQYITNDIKGDNSNISGSVLYNIRNVFVTQSQVTNYVLTPGIHTITYKYDDGTGSLQLDNGLEVPITATGFYALGDNDKSSSADTQRVHVYVRNPLEIPRVNSTNDIIIESGSRYPKHWYVNTSAKELFGKLYEQIGISTVTTDDMSITPYTGSVGLSFLEIPNNNLTEISNCEAVSVSGSALIIGVGNLVYSRVATEPTSSYKYLFGIEGTIQKLFYNQRNNDIWAFSLDGTTENKVVKFNATLSAISSTYTLAGGSGLSSYYNINLVDYQYTSGSYKYGLVYCINSGVNSGSVMFLDGATEVESKLFGVEQLGYSLGEYYISAHAGAAISSSAYVFQLNGLNNRVHYVSISSSGVWSSGSGLLNLTNEYYVNEYDSTTNRIYYFDTNGGTSNTGIRYINKTNNTDNNVHTFNEYPTTYVQAMTLSGSSLVFSLWNYQYPNIYSRNYDDYILYKVDTSTNAVTLLDKGAYAESTALVGYNGGFYGVDYYSGALFKIDTTLGLYVNEANFGKSTIKDSLTSLARAFNLITTVSPYKIAKVSKRSDSNGTIQVLGSSLPFTVTDDHLSALQRKINQYKAFDAIKIVTNDYERVYDGNKFNPTLSATSEILTINNNLIPYYLIDDLLVFMHNYFNTQRYLYTADLGIIPLFQYEPFDSCTVNLNRNIVLNNVTGLIYKTTFQQDGTFLIDFIV